MPRLLGWAITLITILLSAVAPAAAQPARLEPLAPPRKVKAGIVNQISDAGIYIAVERGYFKELGLDVELVVFQSAGANSTSVAARRPPACGTPSSATSASGPSPTRDRRERAGASSPS